MSKTQRERLIEVITINVRHLVKLSSDASFRRLEAVEEATGWLSNRSPMTHEDVARGILSLATVIDRESLIVTAHTAVWGRHVGRGGNSAAWNRADKLADDALRACGVDVDKRAARDARNEARMMEQASRKLAKREARAA